MSRKVSRKGIVAIIIYLIVFISVICWIFYSPNLDRGAAIAIVTFVFGPVGILLFTPIKDDLENFIKNLFIKKSIYRICIIGRPGSGKTTFIETVFTFAKPPRNRQSTKDIQYYHTRVPLDLKTSIDVGIADYKGQNPSQLVIKGSSDFLGLEGSRVINAILFIVDLVPRINDEKEEPLNDESLLNWLKDGNTVKKIEKRVQEQYEYINEASLELFFASLYSENLKSVILLINKLDIIDKLIDDGYLTLSNFNDSRQYAEHHFQRMIQNIDRVCSRLTIEDFSSFTLSAKKTDDLKPLINHLLRKGN